MSEIKIQSHFFLFCSQREPCHPRHPPRSNEPQVRGDEGLHLGEASGAVDSQLALARVVGGIAYAVGVRLNEYFDGGIFVWGKCLFFQR